MLHQQTCNIIAEDDATVAAAAAGQVHWGWIYYTIQVLAADNLIIVIRFLLLTIQDDYGDDDDDPRDDRCTVWWSCFMTEVKKIQLKRSLNYMHMFLLLP